MKQYTFEPAYEGNYHVLTIVDGVIYTDTIISISGLGDYIKALETIGYEKAYYEPKYQKEMQKAKEEYEEALKAYEDAKKKPVVLLPSEENRIRKILHFEESEHEEM